MVHTVASSLLSYTLSEYIALHTLMTPLCWQWVKDKYFEPLKDELGYLGYLKWAFVRSTKRSTEDTLTADRNSQLQLWLGVENIWASEAETRCDKAHLKTLCENNAALLQLCSWKVSFTNRRQREGDSRRRTSGGAASPSDLLITRRGCTTGGGFRVKLVSLKRLVDKQVWLMDTSVLFTPPQPLYPVFRNKYKSLGSSLSVCQM